MPFVILYCQHLSYQISIILFINFLYFHSSLIFLQKMTSSLFLMASSKHQLVFKHYWKIWSKIAMTTRIQLSILHWCVNDYNSIHHHKLKWNALQNTLILYKEYLNRSLMNTEITSHQHDVNINYLLLGWKVHIIRYWFGKYKWI